MVFAACRRKWKPIAAAILIIGLLLRLDQIFGALEYDEIWTLEFFAYASVKKIFTELALPNNHPLNSLMVKCMAAISPSPFMIRLPSLLAGVLSIPAVGLTAFFLFRRRGVALWAMSFIAFSAPLAAYSQSARGYSLQFFFCALFGLGLTMLGRFRPEKCRRLPEILLLGSGVAAVLTLPTSILYLASAALLPLFCGGWSAWRREPRKYLPTLIAGFVGAVFVLAWYFGNFQQFRQAQNWSIPLHGFGGYCEWLIGMFQKITVWPVLLLAVVALVLVKPSRKLLVIVLFPLLAVPLTNAGPPRAFLVLILPLALLAAAGADALIRLAWRRRPRKTTLPVILTAVIFLSAVYGFHRQEPVYRPTDWFAVFRDSKALPPEILIVYPATSGYPLAWNNHPQARDEFIRRLTWDGPGPRSILLLGRNAVNGSDSRGSEREIPLPENSGEEFLHGALQGHLHRLEEISDRPADGGIVFCRIGPAPVELTKRISSSIVAGRPEWLWLNYWLSMEIAQGTEKHRYFLLAVKLAPDLPLDIPELKKRFHKYVRFCQLAE